MFFSTMFWLVLKMKSHVHIQSTYWDSIQGRASGAKILLSSTSLLDGSRWEFEGWNIDIHWCFPTIHLQFLGSFLSHQSIKNSEVNLETRQIIIEFKWIDFCNLLGRVCKRSLLKSSSNTPSKWNDYITSAGPLVGNRCWIQPAGRAKACETNGFYPTAV